MQAQNNEKLSLLVDDELDNPQALALLKAVRQDSVLQDKLRRYALISQAMKTEQYSLASLDFSARIHQQLQQEPIYFLPRKKAGKMVQKAALAVAASVVLTVVWVSAGKWQKQSNPFANINQVAQRSVPADKVNTHFKEYLQAHDNVWYVNNNAGVQSYARLASYQQK